MLRSDCFVDGAEAHYDERGFLYRVKEFIGSDCNIYDYYCNDEGKIVEKRSFDDYGNIFVTVRYRYDENLNEIHETAWYAETGKIGERKRKYE